ncbi:MAG: hypothetical protein E7440_00360 [Ruminococcaceae bacterium]|nr:hypothetical protein [Oscillospiraceae bacterium]
MCNIEYYLTSTGDMTDRTAEIRTLLEEYGVCRLGCGTFVVSGLDMPDHSSLMGEGGATTLRLPEETQSNYAVKVGSFCTVKDMHLRGDDNLTERVEEMGDRHGLLFEGNATPKDWANQPQNSIVSGCFITGFSGGGITCRDTGYGTQCCLLVSDCHIMFCGAGINIAHLSEFHKFTNVLSERNCYGCINNGGNNVFTNCGFNCNKTGFLMDNAQGQSINNSHGSMVGCTINHSHYNEGIGIISLGITAGYIFTGCQVFFSKIVVEDSDGLVFDAMNYGRKVEIDIKGGGSVVFSNSSFRPAPDAIRITDNDHVRFINCYDRMTGEVVDV